MTTRPELNLYSKGRITQEDAHRQEKTIQEILNRLKDQPGIILADEVGMGKTFVALGVAISTFLADPERRSVVIMVPRGILPKWERDFRTFTSACVTDSSLRAQLTYKSATRSEEYLRAIDDPLERRPAIIFLSHNALHLGLRDPWIRWALTYQALKGRHNTDGLKRALSRFGPKLFEISTLFGPDLGNDEKLWLRLLSTPPGEWTRIVDRAYGKDVFGEKVDDLIPLDFLRILDQIDTDKLYEILCRVVPWRDRGNLDDRISDARRELNLEFRDIWKTAFSNLSGASPLLIMDEAHHLKNADTQTAMLFRTELGKEGHLTRMFERMLFLTATPFQLGHHELIEVLKRFRAIDWRTMNSGMTEDVFETELASLLSHLDESQTLARIFQKNWGKLKSGDFTPEDLDHAFSGSIDRLDSSPETLRQLRKGFQETEASVREAEVHLKKWIIRHLRSRTLPGKDQGRPRRIPLHGDAIIRADETQQGGLAINEESLLPFLLAARASICKATDRPVFAEGLASSYEAFRDTRTKRLENSVDIDGDDELKESESLEDQELRYYLEQIEKCLPSRENDVTASHPKVEATVAKAMDLWGKGEKVLIFCHYVETGRVLRQRVSQEVSRFIEAEALRRHPDGIEALKRMSKSVGDQKEVIEEELSGLFLKYQNQLPVYLQGDLVDIATRMLKTPMFLVRFFPIEEYRDRISKDMVRSALQKKVSDENFIDVLGRFLKYLTEQCGPGEQEASIQALKKIQTGNHLSEDTSSSFGADERMAESEMLVPNVRLVNGRTKDTTRQTIMLTFNTPFYPEILIASAVMAEGVDLHRNCRHVIHHDLSWNPSSLEQKTGRVDRIGAKAEACGEPIKVYLPYLGETQDEKMYRVVMERDKWFKVVMGEKMQASTTIGIEKIAERVPLPESAISRLMFHLGIYTPNSDSFD